MRSRTRSTRRTLGFNAALPQCDAGQEVSARRPRGLRHHGSLAAATTAISARTLATRHAVKTARPAQPQDRRRIPSHRRARPRLRRGVRQLHLQPAIQSGTQSAEPRSGERQFHRRSAARDIRAPGSIAITQPFDLFTNYYGGYIQDDFRVNSKLALNFGVRLEHEDRHARGEQSHHGRLRSRTPSAR